MERSVTQNAMCTVDSSTISSLNTGDLYGLYNLQYTLYCRDSHSVIESNLANRIHLVDVRSEYRPTALSRVIRLVEKRCESQRSYLKDPLNSVTKWITSVPQKKQAVREFTIPSEGRSTVSSVFGNVYSFKTVDSRTFVKFNTQNSLGDTGVFIGWGKILSEYYEMLRESTENFENLRHYLIPGNGVTTKRRRGIDWRKETWESILKGITRHKRGETKDLQIVISADSSSTKHERGVVFKLLSNCGFSRVFPSNNHVWSLRDTQFIDVLPREYKDIIGRRLEAEEEVQRQQIDLDPFKLPEKGHGGRSDFTTREEVKSETPVEAPLFDLPHSQREIDAALRSVKDESFRDFLRDATNHATDSTDRYNGMVTDLWDLLTKTDLKVGPTKLQELGKLYLAMNRNFDQWSDPEVLFSRRGSMLMEQNAIISEFIEHEINGIIKDNGGGAYIDDRSKMVDAMDMIEPLVENYLDRTIQGMAEDNYETVLEEARSAEKLSQTTPSNIGAKGGSPRDGISPSFKAIGENTVKNTVSLSEYLVNEGHINSDTRAWIERMMVLSVEKLDARELPEGKKLKVESRSVHTIGNSIFGETNEEREETKKLIKKKLLNALYMLIFVSVLGISIYTVYNWNWFNWKDDMKFASENLQEHVSSIREKIEKEGPSAYDIRDPETREIIKTLNPYDSKTGTVNWDDYEEWLIIQENEKKREWDKVDDQLQTSNLSLRTATEGANTGFKEWARTSDNTEEQRLVLEEIRKKVNDMDLPAQSKESYQNLLDSLETKSKRFLAGGRIYENFMSGLPDTFKNDITKDTWSKLASKFIPESPTPGEGEVALTPKVGPSGEIVYNLQEEPDPWEKQADETKRSFEATLAEQLGSQWKDVYSERDRKGIDTQLESLAQSTAWFDEVSDVMKKTEGLKIGYMEKLRELFQQKIGYESNSEELKGWYKSLGSQYQDILVFQGQNEHKFNEAKHQWDEFKTAEFARARVNDFYKDFRPDIGKTGAQSFADTVLLMESSSKSSFHKAIDTFQQSSSEFFTFVGSIKFLIRKMMPASLQNYVPQMIFTLLGGTGLEQMEYLARLTVSGSITEPFFSPYITTILANVLPSIGLFFSTMVTVAQYNRIIHVFALLGKILGSVAQEKGKEILNSIGEHPSSGFWKFAGNMKKGWGIFLYNVGSISQTVAINMSIVVNAFTTIGVLFSLMGMAVTLIATITGIVLAIANVGVVASFIAMVGFFVKWWFDLQIPGSMVFNTVLIAVNVVVSVRNQLAAVIHSVTRRAMGIMMSGFHKAFIWLFQLDESALIKKKTRDRRSALYAVFEEVGYISMLWFVRFLFKRYSESLDVRRLVKSPQSIANEIPKSDAVDAKTLSDTEVSDLNYAMSYDEFTEQRNRAQFLLNSKIRTDVLAYESTYRFRDNQQPAFPYSKETIAQDFMATFKTVPQFWQNQVIRINTEIEAPDLVQILNPSITDQIMTIDDQGDAFLVPQ